METYVYLRYRSPYIILIASIYRGYNIHYVTIDPRHTGKGKPLNPNPSQKAVRGKKQLLERG
jgi:hypothetical protein